MTMSLIHRLLVFVSAFIYLYQFDFKALTGLRRPIMVVIADLLYIRLYYMII